MNPCLNCGGPARPRATRCSACAEYLRRQKRERPEEVIVTSERVRIDRETFAQRVRRSMWGAHG